MNSSNDVVRSSLNSNTSIFIQLEDEAGSPDSPPSPLSLDATSEGDNDASMDSVTRTDKRQKQQRSKHASKKRRRVSNTNEELNKKKVSWDKIVKREYALVVGDHPLCQDGLPVSLDWQYSDSGDAGRIEALKDVSERKESYVFPRRLSYEERRQRLVSVSGLTAEQVKNDEIDLVVRTLKESWEQVSTVASEIDPLSDMMIFEEVPGLDGCDLTDISDFEWTESF